MDIKDVAYKVALLAALKARVKEVEDALRADAEQALDEAGAERVRVEALDGAPLAKVVVATRKGGAKVVSEERLLAWTKEHYPEAVIVTETVSPAFRDALLKSVSDAGGAAVTEDGEIVDGIEFAPDARYLSVRFDKDGKDAIIEDARARNVLVQAIEPKALTERSHDER